MTAKVSNSKDIACLNAKIEVLEQRITALEHVSKKFTRKRREYTDEQRSAIRTRLLAGQEAARKKREVEVKADKTQGSKVDKQSNNIRSDRKKRS